ncbi:MAG: PilZ domain-containing protein [Pseudomonadota bacterium]
MTNAVSESVGTKKTSISSNSAIQPQQDIILKSLKGQETKAKLLTLSTTEVVVQTNTFVKLPVGEQCEIRLGSEHQFYYGFIQTIETNEMGSLVTLQRVASSNLSKPFEDKRQNSRWVCDTQFYPTAHCRSPFSLQEKICFRAFNISKNGFKLITSLRNQRLQASMQLELSLSFPTIGEMTVESEVVYAHSQVIDGKEQWVVGIHFLETSKELQKMIAQYLVQFCPETTLKALKKEELKPHSLTEAVQFTRVSSESEYQEVLKLRLDSYKTANKVTHDDFDKMTSPFDRWENIIIAKHQGRIISSCLLVFPQQEELLELEADMGRRLDSFIKDRTQACELTRLCTHKEFRGSDLLMGILCEAAFAMIEENRGWIYIGTEEKLVALYEQLGFRKTGIEYSLERYKGINHFCMSGSVRETVLKGQHVKPQYWPFIWKPVADYLSRVKPENLSRSEKWHLKLHNLLLPATKQIKAFFS